MAAGRKAVPAFPEPNPATDGYLPLSGLTALVEALDQIETAAQGMSELQAGVLTLEMDGVPVDVVYSRGGWHVRFGVMG